MSTNETKFYEDNEYEFEFTPEGTPFKGRLLTRAAELEPYTAGIDLSGGRSRSGYAGDAARICGMNREDLEIALNSVCTKRNEEVSAAQEVEHEKASSPLREDEDEVDEADIEKLIGSSGVLGRFTSDAARFSGVVVEGEILKLHTLVACSAQLDLLRNGKPIGANNVLTAEAGRGKNYLCDAVARPLPEKFYLAFESSSAKSLYYAAAEDPTVFKHCWLYPNEAEATDRLVETFRPMLSGGSARHIAVNKDESGRNTNQDITIEGPVTLTIPTVRNKLDGQLQTRMLVAELADYEGRVARHSGAVSRLLSPGYSTTDYTGELQVWRAALRSLTGIRRVIVPVEHEDFCFDSDKVSHGARVWTNVLGLMCANAWLEQRNREVRDLGNGRMAVVAAPEDYKVAYEVFESACQRSVVNISDTHRKILSAVHRLEMRVGNPGGNWNHYFPQKKIAGEAGVAQSTVSDNKTFLVKSLKVGEGRHTHRISLPLPGEGVVEHRQRSSGRNCR
jgi:hypothetical protein